MRREHHDGCHDALYRKYKVRRTDHLDQPGCRHDGCRYFVLDLTHDPAARFAALNYAYQVEIDMPGLAADLRRVVGECREATP